MARIILGKQFTELESLSQERDNISTNDLIDRAAQGIFYRIKSRYQLKKYNIIVFAGPGRTGSVALALSLCLSQEGYNVSTYLIYKGKRISPYSELLRESIKSSTIKFHEVYDKFTTPNIYPDKNFVVDGLFGVGLNYPLQGGFAALVDFINKKKCRTISIDLPSGLMPEYNDHSINKHIIKATETITIEEPKQSILMSENSTYVGKWSILSLGISENTKELIPTNNFLSSETSISNILKSLIEENIDTTLSKPILITGGYESNIGHTLLGVKAAILSGGINITCHIPISGVIPMQIYNPEVQIFTDDNNNFLSKFEKEKQFNIVCLNSDIGRKEETIKAIEIYLKDSIYPIIFSGEVINLFVGRYDLFHLIPRNSILVLCKRDLESLKISYNTDYEILEYLRNFAIKFNIHIIIRLKHSCTIMPSGNIFYNDIINSNIIHSDSISSVLSGVIASFISRGSSIVSAAIISSYIVTKAANIASGENYNINIGAKDVVDKIHKAIYILSN